MLVLEHPNASFSAFGASYAASSIFARLNGLIAESLIVPIGMVMLDVPTHYILQ